MAKDCIDCRVHNDERADTCWADCTLRAWLNGEFLQCAFTEEERSRIAQVLLANEDNPDYGTDGGPGTTDSVFCLSLAEVPILFGVR